MNSLTKKELVALEMLKIEWRNGPPFVDYCADDVFKKLQLQEKDRESDIKEAFERAELFLQESERQNPAKKPSPLPPPPPPNTGSVIKKGI